MSDVTVEIQCGKCGEMYRVHKPTLVQMHNPLVSQLTLIPGWSIDERKCPSCKTVNAPVLKSAEVVWVSMGEPRKEKEEKRIILPSMALPKDLKIVGKG